MAREKDVKKRVVKLAEEHEGCLLAKSSAQLQRRCGAGDMSTQWFQELLAGMKHNRDIRGFSLRADGAYVKI